MPKKFCLLLALLCLLTPLSSVHAASLSLVPDETEDFGISYSFSLPEEEFAIVEYKTRAQSGKLIVYGENGQFSGKIALPLSKAGGKAEVTVSTLKEKKRAEAKLDLLAAPGYEAPSGNSYAKVSGFILRETENGVAYSFSAPGAAYLILNYRNKQESGTLPVYPIDENGHFEGELSLALTYARTLTTVKILTGSGIVMAEAQARKGYAAPAAPSPQPGRLSGITVCIDPGHQENGQPVSEPLGPGLSGKTSGTSGMAQGKHTQRKEAFVTLEVGMVLRDELIRQGATVVMTRERQDQFLTNIERCQVAADAGADVMLRLHCDLQENVNKRGISIYAPLHSTYAQAVAEPKQYRVMGEMLLDAMKRAVGYALEDKTGIVTLSDQFVGNNWAQMPCFLVEMGFMSNIQDDYLLSAPVYQQWLAEGMAQGVYEIALYRGLIQAQ